MQNFVEFYNVVKPYVPKVNLLLLRQQEVEEEDYSWANSKPIQDVSKCHVEHCSLTGTITTWYLPTEQKLATISYDSVGNGSHLEEDMPAIISTSNEPINNNVPTAGSSVQNDVIAVKARLWYVVKFLDEKQKPVKYVVQLLEVSPDKSNLIVQSYISTSYKGDAAKRCFKKYHGPTETINVQQILHSLPKPSEFPTGGRALFVEPVKDVK